MNRKGFTFIEMLAVVLLLGVLIGIAIPAYQNYIVTSRQRSYKTAEQSLIKSATDVLLECASHMSSEECANKEMPQQEGESTKVTLKEMIDSGYLKEIKDPKKSNQFCDTNKSYAYVKKNKLEDGGGYTYYACLVCSDYQSKDCME